MPESAVYRVEDVALLLDRGRRQVYEDIQRGEIPGVVRVGRSIRLSRHAIDQWLGINGPGETATTERNSPRGALPRIVRQLTGGLSNSTNWRFYLWKGSPNS